MQRNVARDQTNDTPGGIRYFLRTLFGMIVPNNADRRPYYSDRLPAAWPQPHKTRDGIPYSGLVPTIRINAPSNPNLTLNPVTATTWFLRSMNRDISAPVRHIRVPHSKKGAQGAYWGRSG